MAEAVPPDYSVPPPQPVQTETWQQPFHSPAPQPKDQRRLGVVLVLLTLLLVLGGGCYIAISALGGHLPGFSIGQATIRTSTLNQSVTYAGLDVTLLTAQQSQNFSDDPHSANDGMLRLNLREQNATSVPINWNYNASARLIVQGQPNLAPIYVKSRASITPGATLTSVIDFAVPNGGNLHSMVFQLGEANEAQMHIPLAGQTDLSKYQPTTIKQGKTFVYFGLNWTLVDSTVSLSIPGQQASSGMEYLTLDFAVDNPLTQEAISGSPFEYLRVKLGDKTLSPISTTLPVSFASATTGKTGAATLLIPQNSRLGTLLMLSQDPGGSGQASTDFPI